MKGFEKFIKTITFWEILKGLKLTFSTMLTKPVTKLYPIERPVIPPVFRGLHAMRRHPDGTRDVHRLRAMRGVLPDRVHKDKDLRGPDHKKKLDSYEIELLKCLFCGYCVEACPVRALTMTQEYELASYSKEKLLYTREMLLANGDRYRGKETHLD